MAKYVITHPWFGKKKGEIIETDELHPALRHCVTLLDEGEDEKAKAAPKAAAKADEKAKAAAK